MAHPPTNHQSQLPTTTQARLRLACASGVLKLMRNQHVQHRLLPADRWRALAWVLLDGESSVAGGFTRKMAKAVRTARVQLKFLAILSLAALEQDEGARGEARCVCACVCLCVWMQACVGVVRAWGRVEGDGGGRD
jgi:hypothetical protein